MDRRNFLRRTALALPALVVGDAALEALERLTHTRKSFPVGGLSWDSGISIRDWRHVVRRGLPSAQWRSINGPEPEITAREVEARWKEREAQWEKEWGEGPPIGRIARHDEAQLKRIIDHLSRSNKLLREMTYQETPWLTSLADLS